MQLVKFPSDISSRLDIVCRKRACQDLLALLHPAHTIESEIAQGLHASAAQSGILQFRFHRPFVAAATTLYRHPRDGTRATALPRHPSAATRSAASLHVYSILVSFVHHVCLFCSIYELLTVQMYAKKIGV